MKDLMIKAKLVAKTAMHPGSGEASGLTDALLRRDAAGSILLPGTALAGALRGLLTRLAPRLGSPVCQAFRRNEKPCVCDVCKLMGDIFPTHRAGSTSAASRLLVYNACLRNGAAVAVRDGLGVDRECAVAAARFKFDKELLSSGATFSVRMKLKRGEKDDRAMARLLAAGLFQWKSGRAWVGAGASGGLGRFELRDLSVASPDLEDPASLLSFLCSDDTWRDLPFDDASKWLEENTPEEKHIRPFQAKVASPAASASGEAGTVEVVEKDGAGETDKTTGGPEEDRNPEDWEKYGVARSFAEFSATLAFDGPFLSHDATTAAGSGFDHAPLLSGFGDWRAPTIPGSSLRGVLRQRAEKIARTVAGFNCSEGGGDGESFLSICPACSPVQKKTGEGLCGCAHLIAEKFKARQRAKKQREGMEEEYLCLACRLFGSTWQGSRLRVDDAFLADEEGKRTSPEYKMLDFLAVDRFTGGGRDQAKFDALALWSPMFRFQLHLENPKPWELGWLAWTLRDMADGWTTAGFGSSKGFGRAKLTNCEATLGYIAEGDDLGAAAVEKGTREGLFNVVQVTADGWPSWKGLVSDWVRAFQQELEIFRRMPETVLAKDSYFGSPDQGAVLSRYYPMEVEIP